MSNPTMAMRIDDNPFDLEILGRIVSSEFGSADVSQSLIEKGHCSPEVDGTPLYLHLLQENRCLVIEPRDEPGWTTMFNICRSYSHKCGIRLAIFDQEYSYCICVDGDSTVDDVYHKMEADPFEAERIMREMGIGH